MTPWLFLIVTCYLAGALATCYLLWRSSRRLGPAARARLNWWYLLAAVAFWPAAVIASVLFLLD